MLRQLAVRAARGTLRRTRRRLQARRMLAEGPRTSTPDAAPASWVRVTVGRIPVLARVEPQLRLPQQAAATLATVELVLTAAGIDVWRVPANLARPMLAVRDPDRSRVLAALDDPRLAGWYRDRLTARNRRVLRLERPSAPLPSTTPGVVVWPYVVADPASTFRADQEQGVAITFWSRVPTEEVVEDGDEVDTTVPGEAVGAVLAAFDAPQDERETDASANATVGGPDDDGDVGAAGARTADGRAPRRFGVPGPWNRLRSAPVGVAAPAAEPVLPTTGWAASVRNGALELVVESDVRGRRADVPPAARGEHVARAGFPIDVVYTWVDGSDPGWGTRKLAALVRQEGAGEPTVGRTERALDEVRFADHDELRHSLRSLEQFAPWVRHVWLVTGGQRPHWLADHPGLTVVDHADIWPDDAGLPTFNSHAIESCLHRIQGLSEHFLYFNDDMVLGRPVRPERFFHGSGLPKFFWSNALVDYRPVEPGEIASTAAAKNARRLVQDACGVTFSRKFYHAPYPLRVSLLRELEERFAPEFAATRRATFRTVDDVAAAGSLCFNYAYATGRSVPGQIRYGYVDPASDSGRRALERLLRRRDLDTFCLNDGHTEQTEAERAVTDREIRDFLAAYLPVPSAYERSD